MEKALIAYDDIVLELCKVNRRGLMMKFGNFNVEMCKGSMLEKEAVGGSNDRSTIRVRVIYIIWVQLFITYRATIDLSVSVTNLKAVISGNTCSLSMYFE